MKGRSVARCREPVNVIYCYITILIQPEALISLLDESVLSPTMLRVMLSPMTQLDIILVLVVVSWIGIFLIALNHQNVDKGTMMGRTLIVATIIGFVLAYFI